jgi:methylglyoxal synthase
VLALIAHDNRKGELLEFIRQHLKWFRAQELVATGSTGAMLRRELELNVECVPHGPEGGDLVIGGRVALGQIDAVLFFRDPLTAQPHEPDVSALKRVSDVHNVPLATNRATAEGVIARMMGQCRE